MNRKGHKDHRDQRQTSGPSFPGLLFAIFVLFAVKNLAKSVARSGTRATGFPEPDEPSRNQIAKA
jgi:hypothetical protein